MISWFKRSSPPKVNVLPKANAPTVDGSTIVVPIELRIDIVVDVSVVESPAIKAEFTIGPVRNRI